MKIISLDEIDEKIVALFQENGRLSNRAAGRELGLSESSIRKRLKRLTDAGAISYGLVMDEWATGLRVSGWLSIDAQPAQARRIAEHLGAIDLCALSFVTTGPWNIVAYIYAVDVDGLRQTIAGIERLKGVHRLEFREAVEVTQNRNELIMFSDRATHPRWPIER